MITLRQLRYVEALARLGHFGHAANAVGVTQPALSMQIRDLEAQLGGRLFERAHSGAIPTQLGREVAGRAGRILAELADLEALGSGEGALKVNRLRVGVIPSIAPFLLPELLPLMAVEMPQTKVSLRESITDVLVEDLANGRVDVIIASIPLDQSDFVERPAFDDRFFLAAPAGSRFAGEKAVRSGEILAEELILLEDGHCLRDQALSVCHTIDPSRLQRFGATSLATILHMVAAGHGMTLAPELCLGSGVEKMNGLAIIPFEDPAPARTIGLAWRRSSPSHQMFEQLCSLVAEAGKASLHKA